MIVHADLTDFELLIGAQLLTDPALIGVRALIPVQISNSVIAIGFALANWHMKSALRCEL